MKSLVILIVIGVFAGVFMLTTRDRSVSSADNVTITNGVQVIDLRAKGGYTPRRSTAKAGIPTILKVNTSSTFDCSSAIRIPSLDVYKNLPASGKTEIDLGTPVAGVLQGNCGMGMYPFEIDFQS